MNTIVKKIDNNKNITLTNLKKINSLKFNEQMYLVLYCIKNKKMKAFEQIYKLYEHIFIIKYTKEYDMTIKLNKFLLDNITLNYNHFIYLINKLTQTCLLYDYYQPLKYIFENSFNIFNYFFIEYTYEKNKNRLGYTYLFYLLVKLNDKPEILSSIYPHNFGKALYDLNNNYINGKEEMEIISEQLNIFEQLNSEKFFNNIYKFNKINLAKLSKTDFINIVYKKFKNKCIITNEKCKEALDIVNIVDSDDDNKNPNNALLLRADLYKTYINKLWSLNKDGIIKTKRKNNVGPIINFRNKKIKLPQETIDFIKKTL